MRILFLIFAIATCFSAAYALNFKIVVTDTIASGTPGDEIVLDGKFINLTSNPLLIEIIRETNAIPAAWFSSLCLNGCYPNWVNTVSGTVPANDSLEFSIHFFTDMDPAEGSALLRFKEIDSKESVSHLFTAKTTTIDISKEISFSNNSFRLWGNYPNPFNPCTNIRFDAPASIQSARFEVFSINGSLVYECTFSNIPAGENQISYNGVNLNGYPIQSGIYVYHLSLLTRNGSYMTKSAKFTMLK